MRCSLGKVASTIQEASSGLRVDVRFHLAYPSIFPSFLLVHLFLCEIGVEAKLTYGTRVRYCDDKVGIRVIWRVNGFFNPVCVIEFPVAHTTPLYRIPRCNDTASILR